MLKKIHHDQNAFVKGRTIFDAVRTVNDVLDFTKMKGFKGIMSAIDFEKAFDSLRLNFLYKSLEVLGFGASFITWIKIFYKNITSCVVNNGFFTRSFQVKRGVRQGDPLSPSLFIIVLELLAVSIRNNHGIKGITVGGNEIKLVIFADDMTTFVRDKQSYLTLFNVVNLFGIHTGLKINHDKTESLLLGNLKESASSLELDVCEFKRYVKILGVYFTYNTALFHKLNFESVEKSLKELLKGWSWRGLTLIGKVQIIKSFALPKVLYRLTVIASNKEFIKKINTLLFSFVWKGKDKVKRTVLINQIEKGGLKMPDLNSIISTQRIMCIKKYLTPYAASWKSFLDFHLRKVGGKFLFHCNFNYSKLSIILPKFYKECIMTWASLNCENPSSASEIFEQFLWNNRFICIDSRSVYNQKLIDVGVITVRNLLDSHGNLKQFGYLQHEHVSPIDHYFLFSLFSAIPKEWRRLFQTKENAALLHDNFVDLDSFSLRLGGEKLNVKEIQSKLLYATFSCKTSSNPTSMKKYNEMFNTETFELDWERIFSFKLKITLNTKLREFQYKILHRICYTNILLFKFGLADSPLCYFCNKELETLEHFLFYCSKVSTFWNELNILLKSQKLISKDFHIKDILFRLLSADNNDDNILVIITLYLRANTLSSARN